MKTTKSNSRSKTNRNKKFQKPSGSGARVGNLRKIRNDSSDRNYQDEAEVAEYNKGYRAGKTGKFEASRVKDNYKKNDPTWYFKDKRILEDVASFSFNKALGTDLQLDVTYALSSTQVNKLHVVDEAKTVPGLLAITLGLAAGDSQTASSPLNVAANNVYSYVRYKNSGGANYDAPDLMLYLLAMDSVYACWNWMKRIYGMASTYSQMNRYMPLAWITANGVDAEDLFANLADFRAFLNMAANRISAFAVPATMTYMVRHSWLFGGVFTDSNTYKAQQYMYVPSYFYKYDETTSPTGGQLVPIKAVGLYTERETVGWTPFPNLKVSALKSLLNNLINALDYSEDIGIMSGDIIKAYGNDLFTLSVIEPDYKVEPVFSEEVLTQIENATVNAFSWEALQQFKIGQNPNTNYVTTNYKWDTTVGNYAPSINKHGALLNFHKDNITPEDVIVATRLATIIVQDDTTHFHIASVGSEFITSMAVVHYGSYFSDPVVSSKDAQRKLDFRTIGEYLGAIWPGANAAAQGINFDYLTRNVGTIALYYQFDWAPLLLMAAKKVYDTSNPHSETRFVGIAGDLDMYSLIDANAVAALNDLAILSEFNVPN